MSPLKQLNSSPTIEPTRKSRGSEIESAATMPPIPGGASALDQRPTLLVTTVEIGDGRSATIELFEGDDPAETAARFCRAHGLPESIVVPLTDHIVDNLELEGIPSQPQSAEVRSMGAQRLAQGLGFAGRDYLWGTPPPPSPSLTYLSCRPRRPSPRRTPSLARLRSSTSRCHPRAPPPPAAAGPGAPPWSRRRRRGHRGAGQLRHLRLAPPPPLLRHQQPGRRVLRPPTG